MRREGLITRRRLLELGLALPLPLVLAARAAASGGVAGAPAALQATPACDGQPTPPETAGPYFEPGSPARTSLLTPTMPGTRLLLSGLVLSTSCTPVAGALLDFWQADATGSYDNLGYRLRGHQRTDWTGRYSLETIVPALYPGRTRHIHVKVQAPGEPVLTTQLYFPGEPRNGTDRIFDPRLVMKVQKKARGRWAARFDFVLDLG